MYFYCSQESVLRLYFPGLEHGDIVRPNSIQDHFESKPHPLAGGHPFYSDMHGLLGLQNLVFDQIVEEDVNQSRVKISL